MKAKIDGIGLNSRGELEGIKSDGTPLKVMVVDDSIFIAKQLSQILASVGFDVLFTAENGEIAVGKYKEFFPNIDLVTMDITMPKMDGITALQKIIEFDKNATVVMISALGKQDLVKNALISGAKSYIVKPLDRAKVLERILSIIKK